MALAGCPEGAEFRNFNHNGNAVDMGGVKWTRMG